MSDIDLNSIGGGDMYGVLCGWMGTTVGTALIYIRYLKGDREL